MIANLSEWLSQIQLSPGFVHDLKLRTSALDCRAQANSRSVPAFCIFRDELLHVQHLQCSLAFSMTILGRCSVSPPTCT